jgi:hypothetical protein
MLRIFLERRGERLAFYDPLSLIVILVIHYWSYIPAKRCACHVNNRKIDLELAGRVALAKAKEAILALTGA